MSFWTGKLQRGELADLLSFSILSATLEVTSKTDARHCLYVIDWEFAQYGHRAYDLGQLIGDLLETDHFAPNVNMGSLVKGFVGGYGALDDTMAFRVAIHVGVHMMNWCSRHAPPQGDMLMQVENLVQKAMNIVVHACRENRKWFAGSILSCLFL